MNFKNLYIYITLKYISINNQIFFKKSKTYISVRCMFKLKDNFLLENKNYEFQKFIYIYIYIYIYNFKIYKH